MKNFLSCFGNDQWSPQEHRLLGMSGETPKYEPEADPAFTKETEKQEEVETVDIASLNGEDPRELSDMIQNAPQRIAAERQAYQLHAEVQSMEQNGFAQFLIGVDPKNTDQLNTYVTRRNAQLRTENRPYTIGRTRDIISVHMKPQGQENPELTSLKARAAELDRQIGKMNGLRIRSEEKYKELTKKVNPPSRRPIRFKAPNEVTQVLRDEAKQRSLDDAKALSSLQKERADIARQIAMLDGAPYTPPERQEAQTEQIAEQSTEASSQPERVVVNTDTTQNILDPNAKLVIDRLPKDLQASVTRLYCSIPAEENRAALIQALNGFCELAEPVQREVVDCLQTQSTEQPALAPEADTFLNGLPETAKKLLSDAVQEGKSLIGLPEVSEDATKKKLDGLLEKYRTAKTEEERAMAEGSMRLMGVDIGKSNFETGDIKLIDKKDASRPWQALFGIVQILGAVIAKAYGKEKPLEKKPSKVSTEKKEETKKEEEWTTVEQRKDVNNTDNKNSPEKELSMLKKDFSIDMGLLAVKLQFGNTEGANEILKMMNAKFSRLNNDQRSELLKLQFGGRTLLQHVLIHTNRNLDSLILFNEKTGAIDIRNWSEVLPMPIHEAKKKLSDIGRMVMNTPSFGKDIAFSVQNGELSLMNQRGSPFALFKYVTENDKSAHIAVEKKDGKQTIIFNDIHSWDPSFFFRVIAAKSAQKNWDEITKMVIVDDPKNYESIPSKSLLLSHKPGKREAAIAIVNKLGLTMKSSDPKYDFFSAEWTEKSPVTKEMLDTFKAHPDVFRSVGPNYPVNFAG